MKFMSKYSLIAMFAAVMVAGCDKRELLNSYEPDPADNLLTVAEKQGNLSSFVAAMKRAQMDTAFAQLGNYTFLVPTDSAFAAAGITAATLNSLPVDLLRTILRNHIISGRVRSIDLQLGPNAFYATIGRDSIFSSTYTVGTLFNGQGIVTLTSSSPAEVFFNGARVLRANVFANNGVIHTLGNVLMPATGNLMATLGAIPDYSFLVAAINRAGLATVLNTPSSRFTIFAPTNRAFQDAGFPDIATIEAADPAVLSTILRYHCIFARIYACDVRDGLVRPTVQGGTLTFSVGSAGVQVRGNGNTASSTITATNLQYRNGVIHRIDRVLLP